MKAKEYEAIVEDCRSSGMTIKAYCEREGIPVLYDAEGIIAVCGFGAAERCAAKNARNAICIEIKPIMEA